MEKEMENEAAFINRIAKLNEAMNPNPKKDSDGKSGSSSSSQKKKKRKTSN
jgi:hypothetical protein